MDILLPKIVEQGVVVIAFVWLLKYTLDTAITRENRLMDFINEMKDELHEISGAVSKIASDMEDLKEEVKNK